MYGAGVKDQGSPDCALSALSGSYLLAAYKHYIPGDFRNINPVTLPPTSTALKGRCDTRML